MRFSTEALHAAHVHPNMERLDRRPRLEEEAGFRELGIPEQRCSCERSLDYVPDGA